MKRLALPLLCVAAAAASLLTATAASAAGTVLPCGARTLSTPFKALGDANDYWLLADGDFEGAATDVTYGTTASYGIWTASNDGFGISPAGGSEPWFRTGRTTDAWSLHLSPPSTVQSPIFCAGGNENAFRFHWYSLARAGASLEVWATIMETGKTQRVASLPAGKRVGWTTSPQIQLWPLGTTTEAHVILTFKPIGSETWIDDVFIDPYRGT